MAMTLSLSLLPKSPQVAVYSNVFFIHCDGFVLPLSTGILERHHLSILRPLPMSSQITCDAACPPLPPEAAKQTALYDMVYVERLPDASKLASGLFLPENEMPRMHICRVLSVGQGREAENGQLALNQGIEVSKKPRQHCNLYRYLRRQFSDGQIGLGLGSCSRFSLVTPHG